MFEPRAQPSNPLLTPEQLAKAEHERLQQLEVLTPFHFFNCFSFLSDVSQHFYSFFGFIIRFRFC